MGMLKPLFKNNHVDLWSKYQFFQALVVNTLLWGCESWAIREQLYNEMDVFLHTSIRTILHVNMFQVEEERRKNEMIHSTFYNIKDIRTTVAIRTLKFIGK